MLPASLARCGRTLLLLLLLLPVLFLPNLEGHEVSHGSCPASDRSELARCQRCQIRAGNLQPKNMPWGRPWTEVATSSTVRPTGGISHSATPMSPSSQMLTPRHLGSVCMPEGDGACLLQSCSRFSGQRAMSHNRRWWPSCATQDWFTAMSISESQLTHTTEPYQDTTSPPPVPLQL